LIPVGFGYGDGDEFFMWGWVWDRETRPRPAPLPSLGVNWVLTLENMSQSGLFEKKILTPLMVSIFRMTYKSGRNLIETFFQELGFD